MDKVEEKVTLSLTKFDHVFGTPMDQGLTLVILLTVVFLELIISSFSGLMTMSPK
jgi:hypothetical protein